MNESTLRLVEEHGGQWIVVCPGEGFEHLTSATACIYLLDSDRRTLSVILETTADEPLDDVSDFFIQQMRLAYRPSERMRELGISGIYGSLLITRLSLDGVPQWQREVICKRIAEAVNVVALHKAT